MQSTVAESKAQHKTPCISQSGVGGCGALNPSPLEPIDDTNDGARPVRAVALHDEQRDKVVSCALLLSAAVLLDRSPIPNDEAQARPVSHAGRVPPSEGGYALAVISFLPVFKHELVRSVSKRKRTDEYEHMFQATAACFNRARCAVLWGETLLQHGCWCDHCKQCHDGADGYDRAESVPLYLLC